MKRRRYNKGGLTEADIAAGLTQADIDVGLRGGRNERISDEDRQAALRSAGMAQSLSVSEPSPKMRQGLSDAEAAKLMGREVRQPAPKRGMPKKTCHHRMILKAQPLLLRQTIPTEVVITTNLLRTVIPAHDRLKFQHAKVLAICQTWGQWTPQQTNLTQKMLRQALRAA